MKVAGEPEALMTALRRPLSLQANWIGNRAALQWLFQRSGRAELPVVCVETRHMQAVLKAQINKTDRNDARHRADDAGGACTARYM